MFSKTSRRPVPSRAALRILYQLAYISSGTAVGVAALCAEERRRRTHYVQKIADNARRLRQSPRHVANVATAAKAREPASTGEESGRDVEFGEESISLEQVHGWRKQASESSQDDGMNLEPFYKSKQRLGKHEVGERRARAPELPSFVEQGYAQVARDYKRVRRRGPHHETSRQSGNKERTTEARMDERSLKHDLYRPLAISRTREETSRQSGHKERMPDARIDDPPSKHDGHRPFPISRIGPNEPIGKRSGLSKIPLGRVSTQGTSISVKIQPRPVFYSKAVSRLLQNPGKIGGRVDGAGQFEYDYGLFFGSVPWTSNALRDEALVAAQLLREGVLHGCLPQVRHLLSWMLANDKLHEQDVTFLCEAYSTPSIDDYDVLDVFELFAELFNSRTFIALPEDFRLSSAFSVAGSMHYQGNIHSGERGFKGLLYSVVRSCSPDALERNIFSLCKEHIAIGQVGRAFHAITAAQIALGAIYGRLPRRRRWGRVYQDIMETATDNGQLSTWAGCLRFLSRDREWANSDYYRNALERFLRECRRRQAFFHVKPLSIDLLASGMWKELSVDAKVNLATALGTIQRSWRTDNMKELIADIPTALRGSVVKAWSVDRLRSVWKTTQNLYAVKTEYERARSLQSERFGAAETTFIEICNEANQPDEALRLLSSSLEHESQSHASLCIAAVSLARKSAWNQLRALIDIIAKSGKFLNDASTSRNLNSVIKLFSRHHTAPQTWRLVIDMIDTIGFTPNNFTTDIMLQCFVSKQELHLIPQWVRYLKTIGNDFQMTSMAATKLLSCFYFDQRPPHTLFQWFSRNLCGKWPSFDTRGLKDVIKVAIGYDLRKLPVQDKEALRERAKHNLARLDNANHGIPVPWHRTMEVVRKVELESVSTESDQVNHISQESTENDSFRPVVDCVLQNAEIQHNEKRPDDIGTPADDDSQTLEEISQYNAVPRENADGEGFASLRSQYSTAEQSFDEDEDNLDMFDMPMAAPEYVKEPREHGRTVRNMILSLSLRRYTEVLELYRASLLPNGLPLSPLALEVATEASIRMCKGDLTEANAMLEAAKQAGMEIRRAMGPILVHMIHNLSSADKKDPNTLRTMVIDYYRTNEENGFPVKNHVAITAANTLINNRRAEYGLNILSAVYDSEWALERPFDIVGMTVFIKGFAAMKSEGGIFWVINQVLGDNMSIDRPFLQALKDAAKEFGVASAIRRRRHARSQDSHFIYKLRQGRQQCVERRMQQRYQMKRFGNLLVKKILACVDMERMPFVAIDSRPELEDAFFGMGAGRPDPELREEQLDIDKKRTNMPHETLEARENTLDGESAAGLTRLEVRRAKANARIARAIRYQGLDRTGTKRTGREMQHPRWLRQYRQFQNKLNLATPDGKLASFRRWVY